MSDYRKLAFRYLKLNCKRSIVPIIGVAVAATVLYVILNLGWRALKDIKMNIASDLATGGD